MGFQLLERAVLDTIRIRYISKKIQIHSFK